MAIGDLEFYSEGPFGNPGSTRYTVAGATVGTINSGEPVSHALGGTVVTSLATSKPSVGTDFMAGIAATSSTETLTANGTVEVYDIFALDTSFLISPNVAATWNTQLKYDNLVGKRVLLDKTAGVYTALAADEVANGCVVLPLDILKRPGKVRLQFRKGCNYLA